MKARPVAGRALLIAVCAAAACRSAGGGLPEQSGETERVELRLGERYVDPAGGLEMQPLGIQVNRVTLAVRVQGITRTVDLTVGRLGRETVSPYTFELVSTSVEPSATILVTRRY